FVPRLTEDMKTLAQHGPQIAASYTSYITNPRDPVVSRLPDWIRDELLKASAFIVDWVRTHGAEATSHALTLVLGAFTVIATFVIIPLLSIYLLADLDRLRAGLYGIVPRNRWETASTLIGEIDGFIRGQLIVAATVGLLLTIALLFLDVPYAFLLGAFAALG